MVALSKLCLFTHTRSFIMLLFIAFFNFIFPFEAQQCYAWIVLGTNNLLKLLDVCKWIFVSILFLAINTCCVKGWKVAHQIFVCKEDKFTNSIVFISRVVCLGLRCSILCRCFCSLLVHFQLVVWISIFFVSKTFNYNNPLILCSFLSLLGLHCLLVCFCLLVLYLIIFFVIVWVSDFFVSLNIFLQQSTCFLKVDNSLQSCSASPIALGCS